MCPPATGRGRRSTGCFGAGSATGRRDLEAAPHEVAGPGGRQGPDHLGGQRGRHHLSCPPARRRCSQQGDRQRAQPGGVDIEPPDHGLGRSRGGLTTKLHLAVEQGQRPLSMVVTAGQRGDAPQFERVMGAIRVPRLGRGRPRTRPTKVRADKADSSRKIRGYLRRRGSGCTISEPDNQIQGRKRRGARGGRPLRCCKLDYRERHAVAMRSPCGGVWDQPAQAPPGRGDPVRQAQRPLRGDRARRRDQRVAMTFETDP